MSVFRPELPLIGVTIFTIEKAGRESSSRPAFLFTNFQIHLLTIKSGASGHRVA
jgi:hypothetical protein